MIRLLVTSFTCAGLLGCASIPTNRAPAVSPPFAPVEDGSLFAKSAPLEVEIEAPLASLFKQKSLGFPKFKEVSVEGQLSYTNEQNQKVQIPVEIHMKGFSTTTACSFPKLELKFKSEHRSGTLFASEKSVDLNTHCGEQNNTFINEFYRASYYNHREALIYRMAEILEIPTLKARPAFVRYKNSQIESVEQNPEPFRAFFLEDMGSFRKRLNAKEIKGTEDPMRVIEIAQDPRKHSQYVFTDLQHSPQIDLEDAARIALFQAMIGNNDWFIKTTPQSLRDPNDKTNLWNTKIAELPNGKWVLFPQDFSLSSMVMDGHSWNLLNKEIFNVVDRATQQKLKQHFINKKTQLYEVIGTLTGDPNGRGEMQKDLDYFFTAMDTY